MLRVDRPSFEYFKALEPKLWKKKREKSNNKNEMTILRLVLVVYQLGPAPLKQPSYQNQPV